MLELKTCMAVRHHFRIVRGPNPEGGDGSDSSNQREHAKGGNLTDICANLPSKRIADQPAAVAKRKLGREDCGAVISIGRAAQQPA